MPTKEELIEMGKKYQAMKEKEAKRTRAHAAATRKLVEAHQPEFETYLEDAKRLEGL